MRNLGRNIGIGLLVGIVLILIFTVIQLFSKNSLVFDKNYFVNAGYAMLYATILTIINSMYFDYINVKIDWKKYASYRITVGAIGSIILTMVGVFLIRIVINIFIEGKNWETFIEGETAIYYIIALFITVVVSIFFHALYFYKAWQEKKVKEHKIIAGTASAKFDALKNQLDPHFLFNSLNVLTSLIDEDPEQAQNFTTALSKVYRYVLEQKNKDLVSVDEELQFARTYVKLLKMRFEDSIQFEMPEASGFPEGKIVPLSLQLLLENAVKHNVVSSQRPLHIKVFEKDGKLIIQNNVQEKQVVKKSSGVGLRNIRQRYQILSNREVNIDQSEGQFTVSLPILTKQISVMETQATYIKDKRYQKAKERVEAIKGFYGNLTAYLIVIPFLVWLNFRTTDFPWVLFPIIFWGLGVTTHGLEAFGYNPLWGKRWEERKIRELMDKDEL
ncbi:MAG: 2TM domain-containing protein [Bacteroidia bacterium]|nr:2TM domain-containing protein [Bacteroidia bacterium]